MNKLIKFLGQKEKNFIRTMLFVLSITMLFLAYIQYGMAVIASDYIEVPAYITDVNSTQRIRKTGQRTIYSYVVHYTYKGNEYSQTQTSGDMPDTNITKAWVAEDNSDVTIYSTQSMNESTLAFIAVAAVLFIAWVIMYKTAKCRQDENSDIALDVMIIAFICAFTSGFGGLVSYLCLKHSYDETEIFLNSSLVGICLVIFIFTLLVGVIALLEMKKWEKQEMLEYKTKLRRN